MVKSEKEKNAKHKKFNKPHFKDSLNFNQMYIDEIENLILELFRIKPIYYY